MSFYKATFDSLRSYKCPKWFKDAKFGIWSIWGPQTVPMQGDWYARNMYIQDSYQYNYHVRNYGHPSKFGYKDLCHLWKGENFDSDKLMEKYYKAGARYFVAMAMHHDHFFIYDSKLNPMNSTRIGPGKDIMAMWKQSARKYNMHFGISEHLSASFSWWHTNKGCDYHGPYKGVPYDGNNPEYRDYYFNNYEHVPKVKNKDPNEDMFNPNGEVIQGWYTRNEEFHDYWSDVMKEMIDNYEPDLLYTDGGLPFNNQVFDVENGQPAQETNKLYKKGLDMVAYYYNKSIEKYGENKVVYTQKDRRSEVYRVGVLDIEKSQLPDIRDLSWQTDSCIGGWFYSSNVVYKQAKHIVEMLVDIISKNGTLLLNVLLKPDGSLDYEAEYILDELADWFNICSEGVYETRPWKVSGEGISKVTSELYSEDAVEWTASDFRYTKKEDTVYAFMLGKPVNEPVILKSFKEEKVVNVRLLGYGDLDFSYEYGVIVASLPKTLPAKFTNCLAIELEV